MLEQTFKALHFDVVLYKLLSVDDTLSALRKTFRQRENLEGDGFVCCIISRGTTNHLLGTDSYIVGLHLDNVRRLVTADACPLMIGKPKLFFIQRYSVPEFQPCARIGHRDEDLETDGCDGMPKCDFIPEDADVLWSHCWTDERQLEQGQHCSIYLKALTDALHKGQMRYRKTLNSKFSFCLASDSFHISFGVWTLKTITVICVLTGKHNSLMFIPKWMGPSLNTTRGILEQSTTLIWNIPYGEVFTYNREWMNITFIKSSILSDSSFEYDIYFATFFFFLLCYSDTYWLY